MSQAPVPDYSLTGANAALAVERGLAEADWYTTPVPKENMRGLLQRRDGPAIRDTLLLFGILAATGWATVQLWGTWWVIVPYLIYAVFYGTSSDSRWHECGHGTAFKTDWMNSLLYEVASFMVMRESVVWRWSHNRHHSDTIIVGRDPEIQIPRPPDLKGLALSVFNIGGYLGYFPSLLRHASGRMTDAEKTYIPESEFPKVYRNARICLGLHLAVVVSAIFLQSWIPIFLFTLPNFFGTWLMIVHNTTQHAGLAENVLDHRLNCRTVYMNPISRFIYWNMNYHVEHHMFPLVPYHALPKLHETIRDDCPPPYRSILSAWREILPAVIRQLDDPGYHVKRPLPPPQEKSTEGQHVSETKPDAAGWVEVCVESDLPLGDVVRFDHGRKTFAVIRDHDGKLYATDGICTHGNNHLADGLVIAGTIECPKHNGRFHLTDGSPARAPICRGLATYPVEARNGRLFLCVTKPGGAGARPQQHLRLKVLEVRSVATFIREIVLEPESKVAFQPGDYLQFEIPAYDEILFADLDIPEPYAAVWRAQHVSDLVVRNPEGGKLNNYSLASDPGSESVLRLNVRIATPPPGQDCPPGTGSAWMFTLRPGDTVTAVGPFGDFHIRPTQKEMIYIGGGSGMAPLRSHLTHLFETQKTARKVSFWYGARSRQELFYQEHYESIARRFPNFSFHPALSSPLESDDWTGPTGFIHEVVFEQYLKNHPHPKAIEFYLCGPPQMMKACQKMLSELGVADSQITFDAF
jgi:MocE subfamily Rieske [2Fe-2S] domain protein